MQAGNPIRKIPRIDWTQPSVIVLVLANLVPLAGVFLFRWEVFPLLFLFWLENVIIGILNIAKMLLAGGLFNQSLLQRAIERGGGPSPGSGSARDVTIAYAFLFIGKLFLTAFFCVHYGMFTFVHGALLVGFFGGAQYHGRGFINPQLVMQIIRDNHLAWPLVSLAASHLWSFGYNYLWRGEYRQTNVMVQMSQPYSRVIVLHLAILFGGFVVMALHSPLAGLVLLVGLKTAVDVVAHQRERDKFAGKLPTQDGQKMMSVWQ